MYEKISMGDLETVLGYLRHQVRELEAELARRRAATGPVPPHATAGHAKAAPQPTASRAPIPAPQPGPVIPPPSTPSGWAVVRDRYRRGSLPVLHTLDCAMSIGAEHLSEQDGNVLLGQGRAVKDTTCACAR